MILSFVRCLSLPLLVIILGACASDGREKLSDIPEVDIAWPSPPQTARIRYIRTFRNSDDLKIRQSAFNKLMTLLAGEKNYRMVRPYAVAVNQQKIVVSDTGTHTLHVFDESANTYTLISKLEGTYLRSPVGLALGNDQLYVADSGLKKVFILDDLGDLKATILGLRRPTGLAFDAETSRLYVADTLAHKIFVYDQNGNQLFSFGKRGVNHGEFNFPSHIFMSNDKLIVNDNMNFRIQVFSPDGEFLSSFGHHGDGSGSFSQPKGIAADSKGNIYVAGATIDRVQIFSPEGKFLLSFGSKGSQPGEFLMPTGVTIMNNRIYVADSLNKRVQEFKYVGRD